MKSINHDVHPQNSFAFFITSYCCSYFIATIVFYIKCCFFCLKNNWFENWLEKNYQFQFLVSAFLPFQFNSWFDDFRESEAVYNVFHHPSIHSIHQIWFLFHLNSEHVSTNISTIFTIITMVMMNELLQSWKQSTNEKPNFLSIQYNFQQFSFSKKGKKIRFIDDNFHLESAARMSWTRVFHGERERKRARLKQNYWIAERARMRD